MKSDHNCLSTWSESKCHQRVSKASRLLTHCSRLPAPLPFLRFFALWFPLPTTLLPWMPTSSLHHFYSGFCTNVCFSENASMIIPSKYGSPPPYPGFSFLTILITTWKNLFAYYLLMPPPWVYIHEGKCLFITISPHMCLVSTWLEFNK